MTNPSAGDTVNSTKSTKSTTTGMLSVIAEWEDSRAQCTRKRRRLDPLAATTEIPEKAQRREEKLRSDAYVLSVGVRRVSTANERNEANTKRPRQEDNVPCNVKTRCHLNYGVPHERGTSKSPTERLEEEEEEEETEARQTQFDKEQCLSNSKRKKQEYSAAANQDAASRRLIGAGRDESARFRKTIQWLEEGARRLREDLANVRTELHEERRAAKIARREADATIREARASEAAKYQLIIADLKTRLARGGSTEAAASCSSPISSSAMKAESMREEHHKREVSALKKRLAEAEGTARRLKWEALNLQTKFSCKAGGASCAEVRRLETEVRSLRASNEKLEEKLRIAIEAGKARTVELRIQHENHEAELSSLRKSFRTETIKMMDELRGKSREIEKLSKLAQVDNSRKRRKTTPKDDVTMRKLRESERNGPIRLAPRTDKKFFADDGRAVDSYMREIGCDAAITEVEVERLRELALEQQEIIEILRQAVKEKERKLEQLSNKRRKEEFYRQWLELEPVAEVDDEEDREEGDSALSSAPSSLSPQPGGCGQWQGNGVTREAYEAVLIEIEESQSKLLSERQELSMARGQIRELEKALLQETRCGNRNAELSTLNDKLREAEEREATLLVELSELREQNELLEFRLLELEESSARRGSPDHTADSGIVSPEPMHLNKDHSNKQRSRAVATVIPYTNSTTLTSSRSVSPVAHKPPLSLQESGIFVEEEEDEDEDEDEVEDEDEDEDHDNDENEEFEIKLASRGTQTKVPAGELLQEVQRLQELRARIQERAAKVTTPVVCPVDQVKISSSLEAVSEIPVEPALLQPSSDQERIRELEERLEAREKEGERREREKLLSKQREEELLDENYRLTERVYWLENELRNVQEKMKASENGGSKGESTDSSGNGVIGVEADDRPSMETESERIDEDYLDGDSEMTGEPISRGKPHESLCSTKAVQTTGESSNFSVIDRFDCHVCRTRDARRDEQDSTQWTRSGTRHPVVIVEEVAKEATEEEEEEEEEGSCEVDEADETDSGRGSLRRVAGSVSQILVVPEEEPPALEPVATVVPFSGSEPEKKVIYFRWR